MKVRGSSLRWPSKSGLISRLSNECYELRSALAAAEQRAEGFQKQRDEMPMEFVRHRLRDFDEEVCKRCQGYGTYAYADTSTWHRGGMAGQTITSDVCDKCWGSGSATRPWRSWREIGELVRRAEEATQKWRRCEEGWNKVILQAEGFLRERDEAERRGRYLYHQLEAYCAVLFAPDERLATAQEALRDVSDDAAIQQGLDDSDLPAITHATLKRVRAALPKEEGR